MRSRDSLGGGNEQDITEKMDAQYHTEDESRSGSAILYGVFALVVTLIVAAGLFFGGRAVYRALTGDSSDDTSQQESPSGSLTSDNDEDNNRDDEGDEQGDNGSSVTPGVVDDNSDTEDNQAGSNGSSENMPSTGDNLPSTGSPTGM